MARPEKPLERTSTGEPYRGSRIRQLREAKGLSRERMADLLEYNRDSLTKVETNGGNPSRRRLVKIAEVLGVPLEELQRAPVHPRILRKTAGLRAVFDAPLTIPDQKILMRRIAVAEKRLTAAEKLLHAAAKYLQEASLEVRELRALAAQMKRKEQGHAHRPATDSV